VISWASRHSGLLVALGFGLLAFWTRSRHPTFDAWTYVLLIESALKLHAGLLDPQLWHPHHLAYLPFGYVVLRGLRTVVTDLPALTALQFLSSVSAAGTVYAMGSLLGRSTQASGAARGRSASFCTPLFVCFAFAFWYYSGEAEAYLPALMFGVGGLALLAGSKAPGVGRTAAVIGLLTGSVLMHQMMAMLAVPLILWSLITGRAGIRRLAWIVGPWGAVCLLVYFIVWESISRFTGAGSPGFLHWVTYYAHLHMRGELGWGHPNAWTPLTAVVGLSRSLFGGHFIFALSPHIVGELHRALPAASIVQEAKLVIGVSRVQALLALIATLAGAFFWLRGLWSAARRRVESSPGGPSERIDLLLGCWGLTIAAFTIWWEADNLEFWLLALPGLLGWVLVRYGLRGGNPRPAIWITLVGAASFLGSIEPKLAGPAKDELGMFARAAGLPEAAEGGRIWEGFADSFLPDQPLPPLWRMIPAKKGRTALEEDLSEGIERIWILPDSIGGALPPDRARRIDTAGLWTVWRLQRKAPE
jgi:hypothetical protein